MTWQNCKGQFITWTNYLEVSTYECIDEPPKNVYNSKDSSQGTSTSMNDMPKNVYNFKKGSQRRSILKDELSEAPLNGTDNGRTK